MATVRQLTTRFNFETDKKGLKDFREGIVGAKTAIAGLAAAIGASALVKGIVTVGDNLNKAAVAAGQFTDEAKRFKGGVVLTGEMADAWDRVSKAIPGRELLTEFLEAFTSFRQTFKDVPISEFETMFEAAGNLARITGTPLEDMFNTLHQAAQSGDFEALSGLLPTLDKADAALGNYIRQLTEVDPTGVQTVAQRLQLINNILAKANPDLRKTAELMVETTVGGQWDELGRNILAVKEKISGPLHDSILGLMKPLNIFFNRWIEGGVSVKSFLEAWRQTVGVEMPEIFKNSIRGIASFMREPENLSENLAAGALSFVRRFAEPGVSGFAEMMGLERGPFQGPPTRAQAEFNRQAREEGGRIGGFLERQFNFSPQVFISGVGEDAQGLADKIVEELGKLYGDAINQFRRLEIVPGE